MRRNQLIDSRWIDFFPYFNTNHLVKIGFRGLPRAVPFHTPNVVTGKPSSRGVKNTTLLNPGHTEEENVPDTEIVIARTFRLGLVFVPLTLRAGVVQW